MLLVFARTAEAGFQAPLPLGRMITTADAIVVGTITRVSASRFTLKIGEVLAGDVAARKIDVPFFPAPEDSPRWAPYRRGQEVVLFLGRDRNGFRILGRLGEGEIPLDAHYAYFHGRYINTLKPDYYQVDGHRVYLQRLDRAKTLDAIRTYRSSAGTPRYRSRSPLHEFLTRETTR